MGSEVEGWLAKVDRRRCSQGLRMSAYPRTDGSDCESQIQGRLQPVVADSNVQAKRGILSSPEFANTPDHLRVVGAALVSRVLARVILGMCATYIIESRVVISYSTLWMAVGRSRACNNFEILEEPRGRG